MYASSASWWQAVQPHFQAAENMTVALGELLRGWDLGDVDAEEVDDYWAEVMQLYEALDGAIAESPSDGPSLYLGSAFMYYRNGISALRYAFHYWRLEEWDAMDQAWNAAMSNLDTATARVQELAQRFR